MIPTAPKKRLKTLDSGLFAEPGGQDPLAVMSDPKFTMGMNLMNGATTGQDPMKMLMEQAMLGRLNGGLFGVK